MQLQFPIFPEHTRMINSSVGFYAHDGFVYYLHNGSPIFCHSKEDRNSYRYILANMVVTDMCSCSEISKALGIHVKNVQRYTKALREKGAGWFFNREDHRVSATSLPLVKRESPGVDQYGVFPAGHSPKAWAERRNDPLSFPERELKKKVMRQG